ncbi:MAG: ribokinase [Planktomarina sp.]
MTIFNLGSINVDHFYSVPRIPHPGETLASTAYDVGLGGKGVNQSVAIAKAGGRVCHIGAVGPGGAPWLDRLNALGVGIDAVFHTDTPTGHAIITVAADGENVITLFAGANQVIPKAHIQNALADMAQDDWLLFQNETNGQADAIECAKSKGAKIAYAAAPFEADRALSLLPQIDLLSMNEGEATELAKSLGVSDFADIPVPMLLVTFGAKGARLYRGPDVIEIQGLKAKVVDTTGAGDTFFGYFMASIDQGVDFKAALDLANKAAALKVTRPGTADAIPSLDEVRAT